MRGTVPEVIAVVKAGLTGILEYAGDITALSLISSLRDLQASKTSQTRS